jgi:hypothetical protein
MQAANSSKYFLICTGGKGLLFKPLDKFKKHYLFAEKKQRLWKKKPISPN